MSQHWFSSERLSPSARERVRFGTNQSADFIRVSNVLKKASCFGSFSSPLPFP